MNALNMIEKNYYKSIADETRTVESLSKRKIGFNITEEKKKLKIAGWILIFSNAAAYFAGGRMMFLIQSLILVAVYAIYICYYPYIYIETTTKKGQENALQMPLAGAFIAIMSCLIASKSFSYDFVDSIKITVCLTAVLVVPYVIKSLKTTVPQRSGRKVSVIFAALTIAFSITFPLNFVLTFEKPVHETVTITDKDIDTGNNTTDYYLYGNWHGEKTEFSVSGNVYKETSVGDVRRICIRKSALGLEYYTVHK